MAHLSECIREGREHIWFSALSAELNPAQVIVNDWCVRCGEWADSRPHIMLKGERRVVEDVNPPQGLL